MAGFWKGFFAIARKEIVQSLRNKRRWRILLFSQCLDFAMVSGLDLTVREVPTVIVDQDHSEASRDLVQRLAATGTFDLKYATSSTDQARGHIQAGRAKVAVVIPPDYARMRAASGTAHILALVDGSDATASAQSASTIDGVASRLNLEAQQEVVSTVGSVTPHAVLLFNPQGSTSSFILPGLLAVLLAEWYVGFGLLSLASERDAGNLERLLMTPMNFTGLIMGKLAPWFGLGVFNGLVYLVVIRFGLGVPIRGSVVLLLAAMTLYVLTCVSLGFWLAAGSRTQWEAQATSFYVFFPVLWLSGYVFPLSSLPKMFLPISYAMPQTHFIEIMRAVSLRGTDYTELLPHLLYFVVMPIILTVSAVRRLTRTVMQ